MFGRRNDREWFDREVLPHLPALYQFAVELAGAEDAEDLLQSAILRAWQRRFQARPDRSLRPWLFAILRHEWVDEWRRQKRGERLASDHGYEGNFGSSADPASLVAQAGQARRVREALDTLAEPFRWVVYLRDVEGFEYREIAEILEIPIGTVMSRLARGRALLRDRLREVARESGIRGVTVLSRKRRDGL
jgi:RNA polymerase sigma-70 factor (ECF subfamily)